MPPPGTSAWTDPDIVEGPWKHCPPPQFAENGDPDPPVARKKARPVTTGERNNPTKTKTVAATDATETPTNRSLEATILDDSDSCSCSGTPKVTEAETIQSDEPDKDEVPEEEDNITKLSRFYVPLFVSH
ncbi:hypothetical protein V8E53_011705 [Lactarius tabidus]